MPPALLVAGGDDPRAGGLDLVELAAQFDAQARDLDRQPRRLHDARQQIRALFDQRRVVHDHAERGARALDGRSIARVVRRVATGRPRPSTYSSLSGSQ